MKNKLLFIKLINGLKLLFLKLIVWKFSFFCPRRKSLPKVLIIKPDHLGDFLITLSPFHDLCDYYHEKGYEITILVSTFNKPIAEACPLFDHVLAYNIFFKDFTYKKQYDMYCMLYSSRFSVVISPIFYPGPYIKCQTMMVLCRAPYNYTVVNYKMGPPDLHLQYLWVERWRKYYTIFLEEESNSIMLAGHNLVQRICGKSFPLTLYSRGFGELPPVSSLPLDYYVIVPGAISHRPWPIENMAQLIVRIQKKWPDLTPVLTGAPNEKHYGEEIRQLLPNSLTMIDKIGDSSLLELFAILKKARFIVSNDTGTAHIAPLMAVKSFVILGGYHLGAFLPNPVYSNTHCITHPMDCFNCNSSKSNKCKYQKGDEPDPCITGISVDDVMNVIEQNI